MRLPARLIEKPWGRLGVPQAVDVGRGDDRIGELWFEGTTGHDGAILVKYLFTSERLSIQVHPNDAQAKASGHASGKDEMWIVLDAEPGSRLGLGLTREVGKDELHDAILDGSIVDLLDWRPVEKGDVIYNKAGTIHAAGGGLVLLEVQQAVDLTYRLFDYGRPRELHLAEGLAVASAGPHDATRDSSVADGRSRILIDGPYFGAAWCAGALPEGLGDKPETVMVVVEGEAWADGELIPAGGASLVEDATSIRLPENAVALMCWPVRQDRERAA